MYLRHSIITGDISKGATPVLIPNTEVKTLSAEHTCLETSRKHRSLPVFQIKHLINSGAFLLPDAMPYVGDYCLHFAFMQSPALLAGIMRPI